MSIQDLARQLGVPEEHLDRFTTYVQVRAYEKLGNIENALRFTSIHQVAALETDDVTPEEALKLETEAQIEALRNGATPEEALRFKDYHQVKALQRGATPAQALKVTNLYQLNALSSGVTLEEALKFKNYYQVQAVIYGATAEEVLQLTPAQIRFLDSENTFKRLPIKLAVKCTTAPQLLALRSGAEERAVEFEHIWQSNAFTVARDAGVDAALKITQKSQYKALLLLKGRLTIEKATELAQKIDTEEKYANLEARINLENGLLEIMEELCLGDPNDLDGEECEAPEIATQPVTEEVVGACDTQEATH